MTKILITGAGGAIGKHLTQYLSNKTSYELVLNYFSEKEIPPQEKNRKIVIGDISDTNVLKEMFQDVDCMIHLASSVNPKAYNGNWVDAYKYGADSTLTMLDFLRNYNLPLHIIFPSSGGTVYNDSETPHKKTEVVNGESPYGIQKIMFENYLRLLCKQNKNISCNVLRISNVYGLNIHSNRKQGFIDISMEKIRNNEPLEIWVPLNIKRDYIHVDSVCKYFTKAISLGSGEGKTIQDLLNDFEKTFNKKIDYNQLTNKINSYYPQNNILDINKIKG